MNFKSQSDPNLVDYEIVKGFEAVGPLLLKFFPIEFETWWASLSRAGREDALDRDLGRLRLRRQSLDAQDSWGEYFEDLWMDLLGLVNHAEVWFEAEILPGPEWERALLVELATGEWVSLENFDDETNPRKVSFHAVKPGEETGLIARWVESNHAGYAAAIHLLLDDNFMHYEVDDFTRYFYEIAQLCYFKFDGSYRLREELVVELAKISPQFAEFKDALADPESDVFDILITDASLKHRGFSGLFGRFADWADTRD